MKNIYFLYRNLLKCYKIDIRYIYNTNFLSIKYKLPKSFLEELLKELSKKGYIIYKNRKQCFQLTFQGYQYIEEIIKRESNKLLIIISTLTTILVGIFSALRS